MALVLLLPTVVSTRLEVAGDDAEVQKGEATRPPAFFQQSLGGFQSILVFYVQCIGACVRACLGASVSSFPPFCAGNENTSGGVPSPGSHVTELAGICPPG